MTHPLRALILLLCVSFVFSLTPTQAQGFQIERVSVASDGTQGNNNSGQSAINGDGQIIAFASFASNLVPNDTNGKLDIFVRDLTTGLTSRVSVASDGSQANDEIPLSRSYYPDVSADGRIVAFLSYIQNLVPEDTDENLDAFIHDRDTGVTTRVSAAPPNDPTNEATSSVDLSADGQFVAYTSVDTFLVPNDINGQRDVFVYKISSGVTTRITFASDGSQTNGMSGYAALSKDGRYVVFTSWARNLVLNDTNNVHDAFVHDRVTGVTKRVSIASDGSQANGGSYAGAISADGRYVTFESVASNLVPYDTNGVGDVFVHDLVSGETNRVSVASDGTQGNNNSASVTSLPLGRLSEDGRYVVFSSTATNLVANDTNNLEDTFVHDRVTGVTVCVSIAADGSLINTGGTIEPRISADGRFVTFSTLASNLVPDDTNNKTDVFIVSNPLWIAPPVDPNDAAPNVHAFNSLPLTLTWTGVTWAVDYEVWISTSPAMSPYTSYASTLWQLTLPTLDDGTYYWQVRARRADSFQGNWSPVATFTLKTA